MRPVVYIDMLFLLNFFMDSILLYLTSAVLGQRLRIPRLAAVSALMSLYSAAMFFPQLSFLCSAVCKLIFLAAAAFAAFPTRNIAQTVKNAAVMLAVFAAAGGIMFALIFFSSFGTAVGAAVSNGEIYLDISPANLIFGIVITYITLYILAYVNKKNTDLKARTFDIKITVFGKSETVRALSDTGCTLCEPLSGAPVIVIGADTAERLLSKEFFAAAERGFSGADDEKFLGIYRSIPFRCINNPSSVLHAFIPSSVSVSGFDIERAAVAVSKYPVCGDGTFDAVFNPNLINSELINSMEVKNDYETKTYSVH